MTKIVRAFPVLPGREDALEKFVESMQSRSEEADRFFESYGVLSEEWHAQLTPQGVLVIVTTELEDEAAFERYGLSEGEFDRWFKERVREVSGIDLDTVPRGAPSREVFRWSRSTAPDE